MDAQTCLKKLQCVGVLNFSTVGLDGTPQARCISAIHYTSDALYFFTARGKEFCRELLHDGQVQILAYTRYKEMIRVSAKAVPVPEAEQKRCIDLIFQEQPYLSNVYPGATREIGIVFVVRDMRIEYFHLGVKPIFRETYTLGKGKHTPTGALPALRELLRAVSRTGRHEKNLRCSMNGKEKQRLRRGRKAETMLRARTRTEKDVFSKTERLKQALETADAVLIGAGAGLSASAGFTYSGERFHRYFSDFEAKYGFHDMYSGGFYAYPTPEEHWAYWSRYIQVNRYEDAPRPVYDSLYRLISEKDYFVLTTNVDHCFQKAGFDKKRLFYTQGDYGLLQCCEPCHRQTYDNRALILRMVEEQKNMRIPTALIPRCPKCGKPMAVNLRSDDRFAEDEGWRKAAGRYADFLRRHDGMHILLWEIGVGYNTPGIIKYPFWQMTAQNPNAVYACLNSGQAVCPGAIQRQSICIDGDAGILLQALLAPEESYE